MFPLVATLATVGAKKFTSVYGIRKLIGEGEIQEKVSAITKVVFFSQFLKIAVLNLRITGFQHNISGFYSFFSDVIL